jgi:spore coat protein U-like protein
MKSKRFKLVALSLATALGALGLAARHEAHAATATGNLNVSASVVASCTIAQNAAVTFVAPYDPVNVHLTADDVGTGSLVVACTSGTSATIGLGYGNNPTGTQRRMASGANRLPYQFYTDAARTIPWLDIGNPANNVSYNSTTSTPSVITVYAQIDHATDAPVGAYTDVVVATIQF